MNRRIQLFKYLLADYISASVAWAIFYIYRKLYIEADLYGTPTFVLENKFYLGIALIPIFWCLLYYASGYYKEVIRKSRLSELFYTVRISVLGVIILFFSVVLDDTIGSYSNYYDSFSVLLCLQFSITYFFRLLITTHATRRIHRGDFGFNTLILGGNEKAVAIYDEIKSQSYSTGNIIIGFVGVNGSSSNLLSNSLPLLGGLQDLKNIIEQNNIEEVIIAIEYSDHDKIEKILNILIDSNVIVKTIPGMYEIFTGKVKMSAILGTPLIEISHQLMPAWQENLKYFMDIVLSLIALLISLPLIIFLMVGVKISSKGPIFYRQERIGKNGKPFTIYKFRSMFVNSESNGPELSSKQDSRVTKFGRFMRKSRLDEIPNFINVLKGDMSLVGPRPERQYFIDKISDIDPRYIQLLKVRPGITSWGQVKYGYAENVDQMLRRMKYDLIYLENMSIYVDLKILIYTVQIVLKRKGV
ncbi:MAG: sugar transferase [Bacteroidales bacterium]|nr:sugar transferase [Bacteroidales bacterium]